MSLAIPEGSHQPLHSAHANSPVVAGLSAVILLVSNQI